MFDANDFSEEFDSYWIDICDYANQLGVSPRYIEEEFCIEGELVKSFDIKVKVIKDENELTYDTDNDDKYDYEF